MAEANNKTRVYIVDDHPIVREGVAQLIDHAGDMVVCGQASDARTAMKEIDAAPPDIVIVDISLEGVSGLQLVKDLTTRHRKIGVLVLSMHDERIYAERALHAGAKGYVMKQEATKKVVAAIRQVMKGDIYLSEDLSARMIHKFVGKTPAPGASPLEVLTDRELEVFNLIGQGFKTREIGEKLHLSVKTIETYREHIKNKLNLANSTELSRYAIETVHIDRP